MLTSTAGHELFHMIKNLAAEYAEDFTAFVIDHLKEAGQYESVFNDYARRYGMAYANDESFKAKIEEEIVAEHCFEALTNKEQWEKDVAEMTAMFGTFGAAYRQYGKKLNMRAQGTENAVHIDEIWDDLCAAVIRDVLYIFQSPTRPRLPNTSFLQSSSGPLFAAAYG